MEQESRRQQEQEKEAEKDVLYKGRPKDAKQRLKTETAVYDLLDSLHISYERVDHEAADTMEACAAIDKILAPAVICKNLFLCNAAKTKFYLLLIREDKKFKTKEISHQIGSSRLSFAPEEAMEQYLKLKPGSVSIMGLMNDKNQDVTLVVDEEVLQAAYFACHPCVNTSSIRLRTADVFQTFLQAVHHDYLTVKLVGEQKEACLCCGCKTIEHRGAFEICPVCFWEDDAYLQSDEDRAANADIRDNWTETDILALSSGANNGMTIGEARRNYALFGACEKKMLPYVRKPFAYECAKQTGQEASGTVCQKPPVVLMNMSGVCMKQETFLTGGAEKVQLTVIDAAAVTGTDGYCDDTAYKKISELTAHYTAEGLHYLDGGNYHYLSKLWTDKIQIPFDLIVFDHHPDMQPPQFGDILSCGGWIKAVLESNAHVRNVYVIGVNEELITEEMRKFSNAHFVTGQALDQEVLEKETALFANDKAAVYISVDKDVLRKEECQTNWDQGDMTADFLIQLLLRICQNKTVIGIDVCGEMDATEAERDREQNQRNGKLNCKFLEFINYLEKK